MLTQLVFTYPKSRILVGPTSMSRSSLTMAKEFEAGTRGIWTMHMIHQIALRCMLFEVSVYARNYRIRRIGLRHSIEFMVLI